MKHALADRGSQDVRFMKPLREKFALQSILLPLGSPYNFISFQHNHFMTMLECRVGSLQDLFPGNCAGFVKERNQQTPGGAAGD